MHRVESYIMTQAFLRKTCWTIIFILIMHHEAISGGTLPGDSSGQAYAVPFPEGIFFWDTPTYGWRPNAVAPGVDANSFANIPAFLWATPLSPLGGRLELAATIPSLFVGFPNTTGHEQLSARRGLYNSLFAAVWAFDLGNGFNVSFLSGGYIPEDPGKTGVSTNAWVAREGLNLAYLSNGWKAAANLTYQRQGNNLSTNLPSANDNFVYDLTFTKTLNKLEFGAVAFGSCDVDKRAMNLPAASKFAMGGIIGYDFGNLEAQIYATHDVAQRNLGGYETRIWSRVAVPLWTPPGKITSQDFLEKEF